MPAAPPRADAIGEADETDDEGALAAPEVGEAAAEQQQAAEGERVGGDDPLALAVGEAEVGLRGGEGDVHDGGVEHHHQLGEADDGERHPVTAVASGWAGGGEDMTVDYIRYCGVSDLTQFRN